MAFLSAEQLEQMEFKALGVDVLISDKASIYNPEQISIGDHSRIDDFCVVSCACYAGDNGKGRNRPVDGTVNEIAQIAVLRRGLESSLHD